VLLLLNRIKTSKKELFGVFEVKEEKKRRVIKIECTFVSRDCVKRKKPFQ
jgi:hypothetical protein